jgi:aspartyl-tRNA(Asn)/glutamyl-tRNA(Gln) amidotransferase subunit A
MSRRAAPRPAAPSRADLPFLSVTALAALIARRKASPVEIVAALLDRIDRLDGMLHAYITVCGDAAMEAARTAERDIFAGRRRGPLHGIPLSVKDIAWTRGVRTTAHSRTLLDFIPRQDATHVARLRRAGMILLGKTNTTEFANGGLELFGMARNPWSLAHYTGGSSAGSASAVSAGLAVAATGSDTGGSIRVPASFCGVVGLKPTYGRVSRHGVIPLSWSLDNAGPMTRTVRDCALLLRVMAGYDPLDPSSARRRPPDVAEGLRTRLPGVVLGVPQQHYYDGLTPDVDRAIRAALRELEHLGARLEPVSLPRAGDLEPAYQVIIAVESFAAHAARLRAHASEYSARSRRRIACGAFFTAADYQQALQIRRLWAQEVDEALKGVDALVVPTLPHAAFRVEVQQSGPPDTSWGTRQFNLSGHPAITVPCGFTAEGLPVGLQFAGRAFDEATLFRVAHAYEQATPWHERRPMLEGAEAYARA